jgi:surface polysaccharide O-acyltransferase-like enzyme
MTKKLLYLNGVAAFIVVVNHAIAWGYNALFFWTDQYLPVSVPNFSQMNSLNYYALRLIEQLITFGIPTFLLVSGFFAAFATRKGKNSPGWKFLGSRIRLLVIPYLVWSVVMMGYFIFLEGRQYSAVEILRNLLVGQTTDAYYFIPLLVQMYLLTPLIVRLARDHWKWLLAGAALLQILVELLRYPIILGIQVPAQPIVALLTRGWFFPGTFFWFAGGMVLGFHTEMVRSFLHRYRWVFLAAACILLVAGMVEWELLLRYSGQGWIAPKVTLIDVFYSLSFLGTFIGFDFVRLPLAKQAKELAGKSFGVYLSHTLVLIGVSRLVYHFLPALLPIQIIFQPLLYVTGLGIPLILMELTQRTPLKRAYAYVFG